MSGSSAGGVAGSPEAREQLLRRALLVCLGLAVLTELGVRLAAPRWWADPQSVETPSAALLQDRLAALGGEGGVVFLGDSVAYGSALREQGDRQWRRHTPVSALRERLAARGLAVHSFAADGLHPLDLEALAAASMALSPTAIVLELNIRMLSAEAGSPASALARPYLAPWLAAEAQPPLAGEDAVGRLAGAGLRRAWATWRYMELLSHRALQPSLKDRMVGWAEALFPPLYSDEDDDARSVLLDLKIRPYYQAPAPSDAHLGWRSLRRLAGALRASGRPVLVFLTPQNRERVAAHLDEASYRAQRAELAKLFSGDRLLRYRDWSERVPEGAFLDHCHLDANGNAGLARWIEQELDRAL